MRSVNVRNILPAANSPSCRLLVPRRRVCLTNKWSTKSLNHRELHPQLEKCVDDYQDCAPHIADDAGNAIASACCPDKSANPSRKECLLLEQVESSSAGALHHKQASKNLCHYYMVYNETKAEICKVIMYVYEFKSGSCIPDSLRNRKQGRKHRSSLEYICDVKRKKPWDLHCFKWQIERFKGT